MIREHWSIENKEHWVLDVTFNEDKSRVRTLNSPQNLAVLRRMALNALNQETTLPRSLRQKRNRAAMSDEYMMLIIKSLFDTPHAVHARGFLKSPNTNLQRRNQ
ncbi:ISAs1 family transposase, partial [Lyngbya sp. CCAP 1446/10]|nr:ISAs1 family transposase [Lyngbya sp. CCAP 1446/10]